jgi:MscS family membrane protein
LLSRALLLFVLVLATPALSQPTLDVAPAPAAAPEPPLLVPPAQPSPPPAKGPEDALGRGTPRGAARGFLDAAREGDYAKASEFLDLRRVAASRRSEDGAELAKQLRAVLDKTLWVDLDDLSDEPAGNTEDGLPARTDRMGTLETRDGAVDVKLARVARDDGQAIWKISADTVQKVPSLHDEFGLSPFAAQLPPVLLETRILDLALWQWIGFALLLLLAAVSGWLFEIVVRRLVLSLASRSAGAKRLLDAITGPLRFILALLVFQAGRPWLGLPLRAAQTLDAMDGTLWVLAGTWVMLRVVEAVAQRIVRRLTERGQISATALVPVGRRMARFLIYAIGLLFALRSFGVNVTALVAGLGVGGLAVALAAQKTLENLFGGITIIADAPVRVGDPCRFGDKQGVVEEIGLRSTRIRTPERTVIAVPNAEFATLQLENFARRDRFLLLTRIGLRPETTPDQIRSLLPEIERLLAACDLVVKDQARVKLVGFGPASIDVELHAYVRTADIEQFYATRQELLLQVMDVVERAGTGLAFTPPAPAPAGSPARAVPNASSTSSP